MRVEKAGEWEGGKGPRGRGRREKWASEGGCGGVGVHGRGARGHEGWPVGRAGRNGGQGRWQVVHGAGDGKGTPSHICHLPLGGRG